MVDRHIAAFHAALAAHPTQYGHSKFAAPGVVETIYRFVADGNWRAIAAAAAGVSENAFGHWMRRGQDSSDEPHATFAASILSIEAETESERVARIAATADWKAQAWLLERKSRARWGDSRHLEVSVQTEDATPENAARLARLLFGRVTPETAETADDDTEQPAGGIEPAEGST